MEVTPKLQMEGASMAAGLERLPVQESCATLPTFQPEDLANTQAPVTDRGFLDGKRRFAVTELLQQALPSAVGHSFAPQPAYDEYLRMPKALGSGRQLRVLKNIHEELRDQNMPRYLTVAASAAAEVGLMDTGLPVKQRLELIDDAAECWRRSLLGQRAMALSRSELTESSQPLRIATYIATLPVFRAMVLGDVTPKTSRAVYENYLELAHLNSSMRQTATREKNIVAAQDYYGFAHELNFLLAINRRLMPNHFAMPTLVRCDSGQYLPEQTHDVLDVHQSRGIITSAVPVEIKRKVNNSDRKRYKALLITHNMDIGRGVSTVRGVLDTLTQAYTDPSDIEAQTSADAITQHLVSRLRSYRANKRIKFDTRHSVTAFHEYKHPSSHLSGVPAASLHTA